MTWTVASLVGGTVVGTSVVGTSVVGPAREEKIRDEVKCCLHEYALLYTYPFFSYTFTQQLRPLGSLSNVYHCDGLRIIGPITMSDSLMIDLFALWTHS